MTKKLSVLLLACAALCRAAAAWGGFFPDGAFGDSARGTTSAQFLKVPPSARLAALGGAGLALEAPDAFFLNPAGLAAQEPGTGAASLTYESLPGGTPRTGLAYSKASGSGVFSAGLIYNNPGAGLQALDGAGRAEGGGIAAYDAAFGAGWSLARGLSRFGFALKGIKSRLAEASGQSAALDAGALFKAGHGGTTDIAIGFRNFGPPLKLGTEAAPLPFEAGAGLRWVYSPSLDILLEGRLPVDHASYVVLAGELFVPFAAGRRGQKLSGLFARSALNFKNYDDHGFMGAFSGGFGLRHAGLSLDYAFCPYGDLGSAHRVTAGLRWGGAPAAPVRTPRAQGAAAGVAARTTLAVAPFAGQGGVTESQAETIRGLVESELFKTGQYLLVERNRTEFLLKEKKLAAAGLAGERLAAELGVFTGADEAAFGVVYKDKNGYLVTVRLVETATGEILSSESALVKEEYLFREAARKVAAALSAD